MGVSAQKPTFSDAEQSCIRKTRKPLCAAQNEALSAAPERHHLFWKICALRNVIFVRGTASLAGVVKEAIFALDRLVLLASFGVVGL